MIGAARLRQMRGVHWLVFYLLLIGAWVALYVMQAASGGAPGFAGLGADFWRSLCRASSGPAGFSTVFPMWALMTAGMMAPTFFPALATYDDLIQAGAARETGFMALLAGYLGVWLGFAGAAALLQTQLAGLGLVTPQGVSGSKWLTAGLLALAGGYQFSPVKAACLSQCRRPLVFFMQHWRDGAAGAAAMGLRLGALCLGCCWTLMLLAFVGGVMNLAWMGLAMALMTLEKLPEAGALLTRPLGGVLALASISTLLL